MITDILSATPLKNKRKYQKRGMKIIVLINPQLNKTKRQYINLLKKYYPNLYDPNDKTANENTINSGWIKGRVSRL